ncbi:MAG: response regulator [Pseudomonadota bacterium]
MIKIVIKLLFSILLLSQTLYPIASANTDNDPIIIEDGETQLDMNQGLTVYQQKAGAMDIDLFRSNMSYLPNRSISNAHLGFAENGLWLTTRIKNNSSENEWMLSIYFSQLASADLYVFDGNEMLASISDGNLNKSSAYSTPTFRLDLPTGRTVDLYIYVASSTLSTLAPMSLNTAQEHLRSIQYQTLLWGLYYGALFIFFIFAVFFTYKHPAIINFVYFVHLYFVFCGLLLFSGHISFLASHIPYFNGVIRSDILSLAIYITSAFITANIIPIEKTQKHLLIATYAAMPLCTALAIAYLLVDINATVRYMISSGLGICCIILCLSLSTIAVRKGFLANKSIIISWFIITLTMLFSILSALQVVPSLGDNTLIYAFCLVLQTGAFMYAMVSKKQRELEEEVMLARLDAENNFLLVEEQNVHLNIARRDALKASDVKSQFLANMSHEIRTPLNAIIGFSKELELHKNSSERDEHVKIINSAASDLLELVNDLLDFSKMEAGLLTLSERPFSPRDLFEDVAATMSKTAHLKELEFLYHVDPIPESVIGDALKVKQLLSNLLSNALKFTNYGHVGLCVSVSSVSSLEAVLQISVFDSGIGISDEDINDIFKAFHQLDDDLNRSFQGSGLGLVITQELVYLMKGKLEVTSQPSVGSEFKITIPFVIDRQYKSNEDAVETATQPAVIYDPWYLSRRNIAKQLSRADFITSTYETLSLAVENVTPQSTFFVALPLTHMNRRGDILNDIRHINVKNLVILYSGPTPPVIPFTAIKNSPFVIRAPLTERKLEQIHKPLFTSDKRSHASVLSKIPPLRILAVDDMELNLRLVEAWLKPSPAILDLAYDAQSAISKCGEIEYDLILMDVQMPNIDGMTAAKEIRKTDINKGTPIIAVTAHAGANDKEIFLSNGMDDFLPKPIKQRQLISIMQQWCDGVDASIQDELDDKTLIDQGYEEVSHDNRDCIDWPLSLQRNNNNIINAVGFMDDFIAYLKINLEELAKLNSPENNKELLTAIHKMHGACCYTGVPRLQALCARFQEEVRYAQKLDAGTMVLKITREMRQIIKDWRKRRVDFVQQDETT